MKKELAILAALTVLLLAATASAQDCPSGMVSYWKSDEGSGITAADSVGTNTGAMYGGADWATGIVNGALSFNGLNDYVQLPQTFIFHQPTDATLSLWMNRAEDGHRAIFWTRGDDSDTDRFNIFSGDLSWARPGYGFGLDYRSPGGSLHTLVATETPANQWVHIAVTRSGNTYSLYKNGQLAAQKTDTYPDLPTYTGPWFMGRRSGYMYKGLLDEVVLYNRALSPEEILQQYQNSLNGSGYCGAPVACQNELAEADATMQALSVGIDELNALIATLEANLAEANGAIAKLQAQDVNLFNTLAQGDSALTEIQNLLGRPQGRRSSRSYYTGALGPKLNSIIRMLLAPPGQNISANTPQGNKN